LTARSEAESRTGPPPPRVVGLTVVSTAAVIALLYYGEPLLVPLSFALFLSFALRPFVSLLERAGVPRVAAIILILFVMMGGVALLVINVTGQINQFFAELPRYQNRIRDLLAGVTGFVNKLRERMGSILPDEAPGVREVKLSESQLETTRAFVARLGATVGILLYACTIPFLTFFMLKDREKFGRVLAGMLTRNERLGESDVTGAISRTMTAYALGLSFVMLIMAGTTTIALMLLRIDYYYVLGPIAGIAILLPYVGVILSTIPGGGRLLPVRRREGAPRFPGLQPDAVSRGQRPDALHRRQQGPPLPADGHDRVHLLGHDLGHLRSRPRRAPDFGHQGGLRARPRMGGPGPPPRRTGPAPLPQEETSRNGRRSRLSQGAGGRANLRSIAR